MILLVMGMGRSGTSLLMQVLHAAGFDCGGGFIADNKNNPRGYFEIKKVMNFNISILKQASGDEESLYPLPTKDEILKFVGTPVPMQFPPHDFAVKDPRFSLTLPIWASYLKQHDCRILFSRRNPEAIAESMARAYHIDLPTSRKIINAYINRAEDNIAQYNLPFTDVLYEDWFSNPSSNINRIESLLDRKLDINLSEVLDIDLQHCKGTKTVPVDQYIPNQNLFAVVTDAEKENFLSVETAYPEMYQRMKDLQHNTHAELYRQENGNFQGKYQHTNAQTVEWNVPSNFQANTFPSVRYKQYQPTKQWLFILGIDALCPSSLQEIELSPLSPILIVEPDRIKLFSYLKTHSYRLLFQMPQVFWFVGENALDELMQALDHEINPYFTLESNIYPLFAEISQSRYAKQAQQFMAAFQQTTRDKFSEATQHALAFKQKFTTPVTPEKILLVIPAVACWVVLGQGLAYGFQENGIEVVEYHVPFPPDKIKPYDTLKLLQIVRELSPDVIVTLSHASDLFIRGIEHIPIKRIVWYVDEPDHLIQQEHGRFDDIYFSWKEFGERLQNRNGNLKEEMIVGAFPLPYFRSDSLYSDISFVGTISDPSVFRQQCDQDILIEIDRIVEAKLHDIKMPLQTLIATSSLTGKEKDFIFQLLDPSQHRFGMTPHQTLILFLHQECIRRRRMDILCALSGLDVKIYGNSNWERNLYGTSIEGAYQGHGLTYDVCCNVYASCAISLNIHPPYLHSGPNQRDMDIPMCDGFLLTDMHLHAIDRMNEFFEPEKEIALYNDANDIRQKVEYYLNNPGERTLITQAAKARIQKEHMFSQRVQVILNYLYQFK